MTKLYHGTNGRWLDNIMKNGIEPRGSRRARDNWKHVAHRSNPKCVYLTDSYAPYFAFNASRGSDPQCAVVEVDADLLDPACLFPDEDFLEQASRHVPDPVQGTMSQRILHYRARQFEYDGQCHSSSGEETAWWQASLKHLGTCCHRGVIPASAITRAVIWPHEPNIMMMLVWDPTISVINQKVCGDRYRALTAKLMAGDFTDQKLITAEQQMQSFSDPAAAQLPVIDGWQLVLPSKISCG